MRVGLCFRSWADTAQSCTTALACLMTQFKRIAVGRNLETLDLHFPRYAVKVAARDLAVMGATPANLGVNPLNDRG